MQVSSNWYRYFLQVNGVEKLNVDHFLQEISNNSLDSLVSLFAFIALEVDLCLSRAVASRGSGSPPPNFWPNSWPYLNQGGRLYQPQSYEPPRIFRPCDGPAFILLMLDLIDTVNKDTIVIRNKRFLIFSLCKFFSFFLHCSQSCTSQVL